MNSFAAQISGFVHDAAPLPGMVWAPIYVLSVVHWHWRWTHKSDLYTDPQNWAALAAGNLTNAVYREGWLRSIAHIIHITHRTKQYIDQTQLLKARFREFKATLSGAYQQPANVKWWVPKGISFASSSGWNSIKYKTSNLVSRIALIQATFFRLMEQLFVVVMHAVEIYDAFYRRDEAFNEVFINIREMFPTELSIGSYLRENQEIVQKLFKICNIDVDATTIIEVIEKPKKVIEKISAIF